ncbi:MAG: DUF47 family protein [Deltaproteobacteria bacterium]|nr:DUF47 family protein [Deltaproteobacteria bacterium]
MSWLSNPLKPTKDRFMERLIRQAQACQDGLGGLVEYVKDPDPAVAALVHQAEQRGDEERRLLIDELNHTFVTPIDREDLFALSRAVDDVLDYALSTVEEMALFGVPSNPYLIDMAQALHQAGRELHASLELLVDHPAVANEHAIAAKRLENQVEAVYRQALAALFNQKVQSFEVMLDILKTREVYRHLSNAADRADTAGNIITDIIMKIM